MAMMDTTDAIARASKKRIADKMRADNPLSTAGVDDVPPAAPVTPATPQASAGQGIGDTLAGIGREAFPGYAGAMDGVEKRIGSAYDNGGIGGAMGEIYRSGLQGMQAGAMDVGASGLSLVNTIGSPLVKAANQFVGGGQAAAAPPASGAANNASLTPAAPATAPQPKVATSMANPAQPTPSISTAVPAGIGAPVPPAITATNAGMQKSGSYNPANLDGDMKALQSGQIQNSNGFTSMTPAGGAHFSNAEVDLVNRNIRANGTANRFSGTGIAGSGYDPTVDIARSQVAAQDARSAAALQGISQVAARLDQSGPGLSHRVVRPVPPSAQGIGAPAPDPLAQAKAGLDLQAETSRANAAKQMAGLQQQIVNEADPVKRKALENTYLALSGKPAENKVAIVDADTGQKDMMGQPIFKKIAVNPTTGEFLTPPAFSQPKLSATDAMAQAKAAIAGGASKDAVNKRLQELGHKPI